MSRTWCTGTGKWFLHATCDIPEPDLADPTAFLGVDLGIANIATTSDGTRHSGKYLNRQRHRARHLRARLQAKGHQVCETAPAQEIGARKPGSRQGTNHVHRQAHRDRGSTHRTRDRPGRPRRASAHGYGSASPSGSPCTRGRSPSSATTPPTKAALAGVPGGVRRPGVHLAEVLRLRATSARRTGPARPRSAATWGSAEHARRGTRARNIASRGAADWAVESRCRRRGHEHATQARP